MKFNELEVSKTKKSRRVGRGISAGRGKTAGRGTKGQKSRAGSGKKPGFEGGRNPLINMIPKLRGFNQFREQPITVTTGALNKFKGLVDNFTLYEAKILSRADQRARVVVRGELTAKVDVKLQGASEGAIEAITKAGGSFEKVDRPKSTGKSAESKKEN
jgi:large subunit ribosomal protein L15